MISVPRLYVALVSLQALHSLEEVLFKFYERLTEITGRVHTIVPIYPILSFSRMTFIIINIALVAFLFAMVPIVYKGGKWGRRFVVAAAVVEFLNGLAHLAMAALMGAYFPGATSAVGLLIISVFLFRSAVRQSLTTPV